MSYFKLLIFGVLLSLFACKKSDDKKNSDTLVFGGSGTFETLVIDVDNTERKYRLEVAPDIDLQKENPLIIAFHGLGIDSKDLMPFYTNLNTMAKNMKALIVYPQSEKGSWGLSSAQIEKDIKFYDLLLSKIKSSYKIDTKKIYITGMSNGAYFTHILAKNKSTEIASVVAHSGMIGLEFVLGINATRKYPVLLIHGKQDNIFFHSNCQK